MAELPGLPSTVRCAACGFENSTTSLYCKDCGARLAVPPSAIAEQAVPKSDRTAAVTKSKPRLLSAQRPNRFRRFLSITISILIVAALAVLVIQVLRPPSFVPPAAFSLSSKVAGNIRAGLNQSAMAGSPFQAPWFGDGLNAYLAAVLRPTDSGRAVSFAFVRASLVPFADGFELVVERRALGLALYSTVGYRLISRRNGIGLVLTSASLGRLPVPIWAAFAIESSNDGICAALAPDLEILRGARSIQLTPQKVFVNFGPTQP